MQSRLDARQLVFIDETSATTKMSRLHGRSPRGQRCRASVPHGHWKTTTLVCGLRFDGLTAPMVIDGAMTGAAFSAYADALLGPVLGVGDIVVLDNLAAHKVEGVRAAIAKTGATLLYLPPYAPDFNPMLTDWSPPLLWRWRHFLPRNAAITSVMQDIRQYDPKML